MNISGKFSLGAQMKGETLKAKKKSTVKKKVKGKRGGKKK